MPAKLYVPLPHRQGLNEVELFLRNAPKGAFLAPGAYLRAMRARLAMSQRDLAARTGVPQAHICRMERGRLDAKLGTWQRLFEAVYCDLLVLPRPRAKAGQVVFDLRQCGLWWRDRDGKAPEGTIGAQREGPNAPGARRPPAAH